MRVDCLDIGGANFFISFVAKKWDFSQWIANMGYLRYKTLVETEDLCISCPVVGR